MRGSPGAAGRSPITKFRNRSTSFQDHYRRQDRGNRQTAGARPLLGERSARDLRQWMLGCLNSTRAASAQAAPRRVGAQPECQRLRRSSIDCDCSGPKYPLELWTRVGQGADQFPAASRWHAVPVSPVDRPRSGTERRRQPCFRTGRMKLFGNHDHVQAQMAAFVDQALQRSDDAASDCLSRSPAALATTCNACAADKAAGASRRAC